MMENKVRTPRRTNNSRLPFDVPLLLITASLLVFGIVMVYSSSWDASLLIDKPTTYVFSRQMMWVTAGLILAALLSRIDYHLYGKVVVLVMLGIIVLLVLVLLVGDERFNSKRSLLNGSIQPGELAKVWIVIYLSFWLTGHKENLKDIGNGLIPLVFIIGVVAALIILQPDLSAALTIALLGGIMFFLAGGDWKQLVLILVFGVLLAFVMYAISTTARIRIDEYLKGLQNPTEGSYHIRRTFEAIIKGGFFGVGLGKADTKFTGLPLPHSDSIFAVIAEETGLLGAFVVIALYAMLIWRGLKIARRAPDQLGSLISFGLVSWVVIEAMINILVIVGLFPFAGNALPLISAGGSSMVATLAAIGITMNVARQGVAKEENDERSQASATVDLRGRDWRRSVSGANRFRDSEE
ncbi:MAG: putative peptidoglycan glycosyltransferase FtsW [Anaerolineaceae bacterium]|jgi:cell division protein FtsW|nr:putative peptidoglycan glycosyltransferase FtsW [Anaerolineaceae bacterium]HPT24387.1 putative peptidoglycan glycosyltransferase FtsW [Anaerolineaceae bacterium]